MLSKLKFTVLCKKIRKENIMNSNAENVACNFYDWLIRMGYSDYYDRAEDIEDMKKDFVAIEHKAPRLFNLLRVLSN